MTSAPSSPVSGVNSPCFNVDSRAQCSASPRLPVTQHPRSRKRRLTAPPALQSAPKLDPSVDNRVQVPQTSIETLLDPVESLIPKINLLKMDTPLFTPQSGTLNPPSVPFVFSDGFFTFCTPSPYSSDSTNSSNTPLSSASDESFLGVLPDSPRSSRVITEPFFERLAIWSDAGGDTKHFYAHTTIDGNSKHASETVSLEYLDPSSTRYGPVQAASSQLACRFVHLGISLACPPSLPRENVSVRNFSAVEISVPRTAPTFLLTEVYNKGALIFSYEDDMDANDTLPLGAARYSCSLPKQLVDELCTGANNPENLDEGIQDKIVIMRFIQKEQSREKPLAKVILVIVCDFQAQTGPSPGQIKVAYIRSGSSASKSLSSQSPPEGKHHSQNSCKSHRRARAPNRRITPNLSVSIPPQSMGLHTKGYIVLTTDSPAFKPYLYNRPAPDTGMPHSAFPMTPSEQMIHTPTEPPELPRSSAHSRTEYFHTPTENVYPFTLSTSTSSSSRSPALSIFEGSGPGGSAPAWPVFRQELTFSPSFFLRPPRTSFGSSAMASLTRQALDAGTPTLPSFQEGFFDQTLDSPLVISSNTPSFPAAFGPVTP